MDLEILEALALSDDRREGAQDEPGGDPDGSARGIDRSTALAQLLPGSEDCDYYRALHAQHRGALDEADAVLETWPERHGHTPGYDRLRLRQLLYRVCASPP